MRGLAVAELHPEAPVVRLLAPEAGQDARKTLELDRGRLGQGLRGDERGGEQLTSHREQVAERAMEPRAGLPVKPRPETERLEHRGGEVLGERHLRAGRQRFAEHLEPVLRIDPPRPRPRNRRSGSNDSPDA